MTRNASARPPRRLNTSCAALSAKLLSGLALTLSLAGPALACWEQAAQKYNVSPQLLYAIAKTESGLQPKAINRANGDGSYDIGLMQINSSWLPKLARFGIQEKDLYEPCVSIEVGAWILADNIRTRGMTWAAIAAYNTPNPVRGLEYARRVYANLPPELRGQWTER
ncbi:Transglycosylase SLT domain-containing protein [Roseateles sp. YR242]|uniref:lytic transglycosylase domain-containing protein n=1 Tax=Roseateles sp. YR242 TaxID=1855305 RepID=UPI0008CCCFD6|nr:lytic transglycosylase domain-containing protein [Roseateles sp. YR242]SEK64410.1 Transglycosylase SLT domain-containing protein [Roseateles sp. YR242]